MRVSRRLLAVPAAVVLAWSLTACGGSAPEAPATPPVSASATQETVVEPAGFALTTENLGDMVTAMLAAQTYDTSMVSDFSGVSMTAEGQARLSDGGSEMAMSMSSPQMPAPIEMRLVGGQMYVNMGDLTDGLFWQIDATDTSNPLAASIAQSTSQSSAADSLETLVPALVSVEESGPAEQIDGVSTQPYDVVVDTSKLGRQGRGAVRDRRAAGRRDPRAAHLHVLGRRRPAAPQARDGHARLEGRDDVLQLGRRRHHRGPARRPGHSRARHVRTAHGVGLVDISGSVPTRAVPPAGPPSPAPRIRPRRARGPGGRPPAAG